MSSFQITLIQKKPVKIALLENMTPVVTSEREALDLLAEVSYNFEADRMIGREEALAPEFFDLSSGLAGAILQKYTNYQMKIAIVGDFSKYTSQILPDFIRESNKGRQNFFVPDIETAIQKLQNA